MNYRIFKQKIKRLFSMTPSKVIKKMVNKIYRIIMDKITEKQDLNDNCYKGSKIEASYNYIDSKRFGLSLLHSIRSKYFLDIYINHFFDILGSGFIKADYNINIVGIEGIRYDAAIKIMEFGSDGEWLKKIIFSNHISQAKSIWKRVDSDYTPIDWQVDFRSGYRYSQKIWYKKTPVGKPIGADIKLPWEISRMQHLPQLAVLSIVLHGEKNRIIKEFKNEIYDFAATNPLRMGANWTCTMDVGIRAANILLTYDILKGIDKSNILDNDFEKFIGNFIYLHGNFIINNLEWNDGDNNNHYLSDICGLLFISAYLERNEIVDSWLAFSVQELINCMENQFYNDGGNFEASTSYHRLSGELMIYSTALIYGLLKTDKAQALKDYNPKLVKRLLKYDEQKYDLNNEKFFPDWYLDKLFRAGCFTMDITKSNGNIPQIGDNDSGRFFKFSPVGEFLTLEELVKKYNNLKDYKGIQGIDKYFDENVLNHSTFVSAVNGLFDYEGFEPFSVKYPLEKSIVESLSKGFKLKGRYLENRVVLCNVNLPDLRFNEITEIKYEDYTDKKINISDLRFIPYPDFGLYIFKGSQFYLSIFAGGIGQNGNGGHSHNDKLSFELNLCGKDIFVDPGTYVYTPLPDKRDMFRSVKVHNVPIINDEEQNYFLDLFSVKNETKCGVLDYGNNHIKLYLTYRDIKIIREFIISDDKLIINDSCNKKFYVNLNNGKIYSNGYGKLICKSK